MVAFAALSMGLTLAFLLYSLLHNAPTATQRRLETLVAASQRRAPRLQVEAVPARSPRADLLKQKVRALLPRTLLDRLSTLLVSAGMQNTSPELFVAVWFLIALTLFAVPLALGLGRISPLIPLIMLALGLYLPLFFLRSRVKRRRTRMLKALPDAMDLLTTCVEAGLGLDAAIARVGEKAKEPLGEEFRLVLKTMALGRTRREALQQLATRTGLPELQTFANAIIQAETMGVSIGQVLRVQAEAIRIQRKQRAEQAAQKAPLKIIIVLALFIFPSMFIVILGPAMLSIMQHGL